MRYEILPIPESQRGIPTIDLRHGGYYSGMCRNASIARWDGKIRKFYYWRSKFDCTRLSRVPHGENFAGFDYFRPNREVGILFRLRRLWYNSGPWRRGLQVVAFVFGLRRRLFIPIGIDATDDG